MQENRQVDAITTEEVHSAVAAGVLPEQHAQALLAFVAQSRSAPLQADEETFRFVRSFNDIFVTIAIALVLFALNSLFSGLEPAAGTSSPIAMFAIAAASWSMAEYFTRVRRMAFPSIVLLGSFVFSVFLGAGAIASLYEFAGSSRATTAGIGAIFAVLAATLHWYRFRVPITVAAGMAALIVLVIALVGFDDATPVALLASGLATLAVAMMFDIRDTQRLTRNADIAFWLHMLAAPLIVHGLFNVLGILTNSLTSAQAISILAFYVAFGLFALIIDRRALLVSSLIYVLYAASTLIAGSGFSDYSSGITALAIGAFLLMLSAAWSQLRSQVMALVPPKMRHLVPPTRS